MVKTTKSYAISKEVVLEAYKRVKARGGGAGVDGETIEGFSSNLKDNLYKIWNRMSSGSYFPPAVRVVEIPKGKDKVRKLGIPTVSDRIAQMVVKMYLEPKVEPIFHEDSYGYRPNKSAIEAVGKVRRRCWNYDWVIDVDIKGFFDNIDHELMMLAVRKHTNCKWVLLYVERWLKAPEQRREGTPEDRDKGTPQGGVISPLLANLFLHYAYDEWMKRNYPNNPFERYADDIVVHCKTELEAKSLLEVTEKRLNQCKLEVNREKTKIVYCKDKGRKGTYTQEKFEFLGYMFRPRSAGTRWGKCSVSFTPAVSNRAKKLLRERDRRMKIPRRVSSTLEELAELMNPIVRGWINYYGEYHKTETLRTLSYMDEMLVRWARKKYKRFKATKREVYKWLGKIANRDPNLFVHWQRGIKPRLR